MDEVFPVLAGVALGLGLSQLAPRWLRLAVLTGLATLFGVAASWISGELAISWGYAILDVGQVLASGVMTTLLAARWRRRARRESRA